MILLTTALFEATFVTELTTNKQCRPTKSEMLKDEKRPNF